MKIIIGTLLLLICAAALCDSQRQQYHLYRAPSSSLKLNSQLTIEQLINLTEKLQKPPSTSYGVPNVETFDRQRQQLPYKSPTGFNSFGGRQQSQKNTYSNQNFFGKNRLQQQNSFRYSPQSSNGQNSFGVSQFKPQSFNKQNSFGEVSNSHNQPQQSFGVSQYVPQQPQTSSGSNFNKQNSFGEVSNSQNEPQQPSGTSFNNQNSQNQPQQAFGVSSTNQQPQNSFGVNQFVPQQPQTSSGSNFNKQNSFGEVSTSQQPQNSFGVSQNVPQQPQSSSNSFGEVSNGQNQYFPPQNQGYLPPQTTPKNVAATTTLKPSTTTTEVNDYDYDQQPNVSISNAVAVGGGSSLFYLQQPDGRLQKVVLQKTREPNSKPEEYVANYYFQNVPVIPDTVYAPLITLGGFNNQK